MQHGSLVDLPFTTGGRTLSSVSELNYKTQEAYVVNETRSHTKKPTPNWGFLFPGFWVHHITVFGIFYGSATRDGSATSRAAAQVSGLWPLDPTAVPWLKGLDGVLKQQGVNPAGLFFKGHFPKRNIMVQIRKCDFRNSFWTSAYWDHIGVLQVTKISMSSAMLWPLMPQRNMETTGENNRYLQSASININRDQPT